MCPEAKVMFATKYVQISSKVKKGQKHGYNTNLNLLNRLRNSNCNLFLDLCKSPAPAVHMYIVHMQMQTNKTCIKFLMNISSMYSHILYNKINASHELKLSRIT